MATFIEQTCGECGCVWGFPKELREQRIKDGKAFHCPNGHQRFFTRGQSPEDKLRQERDRLKQSIAFEQDRVRRAEEEAEHQRHRANGYKGHATRITKRAKAGVCPCCNRHFTALERHMATKHPEFTPDAPEPLRVIDGGKAVA